jgi:hypothetical protein
MMSWIDSDIEKIDSDIEKFHFQNGRHITAKMKQCSISKLAFDLLTDILSAVALLSTGIRKHIIYVILWESWNFVH